MSHYQIMLAKKGERKEVMDFITSIYQPMSPHAALVQKITFSLEPSLHEQNLILARANSGELIGVIRLVERTLIVDGIKLRCAGVTAVGVKPQWRSRGVCSSLMKKAIALMKERKFDLSVLHARRVLDGFYLPFGYRGIGRYVDLEILNFPRAAKSKLKTDFFRQDDQAFLEKSYRRTYAPLSGSVVRTAAIWQLLLRKVSRKVLKAEIVIFRIGIEKVGYAVIMDQKLVELCAPQNSFPSIVEWIKRVRIKSISIHPAHPFFTYCRTELNTLFKERFALDGGYMARIIDERSLSQKLRHRHAVIPDPAKRIRILLGVVPFKNIPGLSFHTSILDEI